MKAIFKLPQPQPPKPSPADLAPLQAIYREADKAGAPHWKATQRIGLLRAACDFLKEGQWEQAEDATEKAIKREEELEGDYAERFAEALIKLKDKASHKSNGEALKVSLKAEVATKKETTNVATARSQQEVRPPRVPRSEGAEPSARDCGRGLGDTGDTDHRGTARLSGVPAAPPPAPGKDAAGLAPGAHPVSKGADAPDQERGEAAAPRPQSEVTPEHPLVIAYEKRYRLQRYWTTIIERDPHAIRLAVKACKEVGLEEIYKETVWQLANKELHQAHKRAREIAVEAWEGMVVE